MTEQHQECNCHDCTQARYRNSFQFQIDQAIRPAEPKAAVSEGKEEPEHGNSKSGVGSKPVLPVSDNSVEVTGWQPVRRLEEIAQPQPAGTEIENEIALVRDWFEGHPDSAVIEELAARSVKFQTELAALQRSHDECVKVLEDIQANFFRRLAKNFPKLNTAIRTALAKAALLAEKEPLESIATDNLRPNQYEIARKPYLLSCPFCGSDDLILSNIGQDDDWFVSCNSCEGWSKRMEDKLVLFLSAKLAALQRSHDALYEALKAIKDHGMICGANSKPRKQDWDYPERFQATMKKWEAMSSALANAEKLRGAK